MDGNGEEDRTFVEIVVVVAVVFGGVVLSVVVVPIVASVVVSASLGNIDFVEFSRPFKLGIEATTVKQENIFSPPCQKNEKKNEELHAGPAGAFLSLTILYSIVYIPDGVESTL